MSGARRDARSVMVVLPAYNEAEHIRDVVRAIPRRIAVGAEQFRVQVVVVEDGSADDTYALAKTTRAVVLRHIMNCGAGAATRTGLRYAEQNRRQLAYVITIDSDGQHRVDDIQKLVAFAHKHNADMVVGNRLHRANQKHMPFSRRLGNYGLSLISRVLFGITTEDTQSGLRLFSARALPAVSRYTIDRYGFCTEMLWHAVRAGLKVYEMPIAVHYSKQTIANGQSSWGVIDLVRDLVWIRVSS